MGATTRIRRLPSLNALRAFWAAARHGSFAGAADELCVTRSAVSLQLRQLEDELGTSLFKRTRQGLELTDEGTRMLPGINLAFEHLRSSVDAIEPVPRAALTLSVGPSFATKWLLPRLGQFFDSNADVDVEVLASNEVADLTRNEADLAIRYGNGQYPGLMSELLMPEHVFPVCSPTLIERFGTTDIAFAMAPLLHDTSSDRDPGAPNWQMWVKAAGLAGVDPRKGPHFNQTTLAIDAALAGYGIALAPAALVDVDIAAGRLIRLARDGMPGEFSYYVVHTPERAEHVQLQRFKTWLRGQV